LSNKCSGGKFGTVEEAIADLSMPRVKTFRPYSTFKGQLSLGDAGKYPETAFRIDVDRYFRVKAAKPVSASSFVVQQPGSQQATQDATELPEDLSAVRNARSYKINDPTAPGGKRDVDREELAKGYEYGRTAIPISESDENVTKLETFSSFEIIGFIPNDKVCMGSPRLTLHHPNLHQYEKFLNLGESGITIAQRTNPKAVMALSSFIHALYELDSYAVARIVVKDGKDPQMLLLAPSIEPDLEALIDIPLPFAEDVRVYRFPPLDRVITTSGETLSKHRYLPRDDLVDAMSNFVDKMDISKFGRDDDEYWLLDFYHTRC
jgi:ATP-dependent DNA helicase 2 subunit 2